MNARYDSSGNLVELKVERPGTCPSGASGSKCAQWFAYDWDEVGQLARARRWDFESAVPVLGAGELPADAPEWDVKYAYSGGVRVVKSATDALGVERHTLEVFDTLRFEHDEYIVEQHDYERHRSTTHVYFGGGVGHAIYDGGTLPAPAGAPAVRMALNIGDHLGSATVAIDHTTSEVVERAAHNAHGAIENDYRPDRWGAHREAYKFTGKEEDIEVGATYFGARYYNAHLGRFMSADPLTIHGLGADLNPYAYVRGAVMSKVDLDGLDSPPAGASDVQWHPDTGQWSAIVNGQLEVGTNDGPGSGRSSAAAEAEQLAARTADTFARVESTAIGLGGGAYITPGDVHKEVANAIATLPANALIGALDPFSVLRFAAAASGHPIAPRVIPASNDPKNVSGIVAGTGLTVFAVVTGTRSGGAAAETAPTAYSVAFETELAESQLGLSRGRHFTIANEALADARAASPELAELVPGPPGRASPPSGWVWQHATIEQGGGRPGVMQLVPKAQHTAGSPFWRLLHPLPNGGGGYSQWAIPAGAPPN